MPINFQKSIWVGILIGKQVEFGQKLWSRAATILLAVAYMPGVETRLNLINMIFDIWITITEVTNEFHFDKKENSNLSEYAYNHMYTFQFIF